MKTAEVLVAGWCPLDCSYCYIPKSDELKKIHSGIIKQIISDEYWERLCSFSPDTEGIGLWGTEPLLTISLVKSKLDKMISLFPNLKNIYLSTSLLVGAESLAKFINTAREKGINIAIQVSLDGPPFITEKTRGKGVFERVVENSKKLVSSLEDGDGKVLLQWKATARIENIKEMVEEEEKLEEYFEFYMGFIDNLRSICAADGVTIKDPASPMLMFPGKYTAGDGRVFAEFCSKVYEKGYLNGYYLSVRRILLNAFPPESLTCTGGNHGIGFDGEKIHICHRSFFMDREEYLNSVLGCKEFEKWDVSLFEQRLLDNLKNWYVVKDKKDVNRFLYVMKCFHDFPRTRMATIYASVKELAKCGLVSKKYLENDELARVFSAVMAFIHACPLESVLNTGSPHLYPHSLIKLFGNGAFEIILKGALEYG